MFGGVLIDTLLARLTNSEATFFQQTVNDKLLKQKTKMRQSDNVCFLT